MKQVAISVEQVSVRFGGRFTRPEHRHTALDAVDLTVEGGSITGLLGPNGSGKTTLLRVLAGDQPICSGRAQVLGHAPDDRRTIAQVGVQYDAPLPLPQLSGIALLRYFAALRGIPRKIADPRIHAWLERLDLVDAGSRPTRDYSTGMARRLGFVAAVLGDPAVLLLDEPTGGLDPDGSLRLIDTLRELAEQGTSILMASHHLQEVEQICDRVHLLRHGRLVMSGALDDVLGIAGVDEVHIRDLPSDARPSVTRAVEAAGGAVLEWRRARRHLFALFRRTDARG